MKKILLILFVGLILFGCAGQSQVEKNSTVIVNSGNSGSTTASTDSENASALVNSTNLSVSDSSVNSSSGNPVIVINVTAKQWEFSPNVITVKKGDNIRLMITSLDVKHGFMLPDFNINKQIEPGETTIVEFVANKTGEFDFRCSVMCGAGHMEQTGKLIVTE
ncbi:MAG: cupredoxin domain-containing protein [Candidatus Micrarchaeota archaeon]|nr:cupredoxin domain-containing protein [Candidatus Micrarchaeota archaeon]